MVEAVLIIGDPSLAGESIVKSLHSQATFVLDGYVDHLPMQFVEPEGILGIFTAGAMRLVYHH